MPNRTDSLTSDQRRKYAEWLKEFRSIFTEKTCMAKNGDCTREIVRSHTVSRSQYLSKIAESGHVLQWKHFPWSVDKEGVLNLEPIGLNDASTFNGFCGYHDTKLFSDIDTKPFAASPPQLFAQAYRAHARELYCKRVQTSAMPDPKKLADFHGLEDPESYVHTPFAFMQMASMDTGFRDTLHHARMRCRAHATCLCLSNCN